MKIVHLIDYFQPKVGYQEYFLAREHQRLGHEVYVVTSNRYFPFPNYQTTYQKILGGRVLEAGIKTEEGVKTVRLKSFEFPGTNLIILFGLKKIISSLRPQVVFCHGTYSLASYWIATLKPILGFKLVYDTHAAAFNTNFNRSLLTQLYHLFFRIVIMPKIKREQDAIFAIGEEEQKFLAKDFGIKRKNIPIIRHGVDTRIFFFSPDQRKKMRRRLKIFEKEIVIIYAGKITVNKEIHILFQAVSELKSEKIKLLVIGGGEKNYLERLKKIIHKDQVIWLDFRENRELFSYYCAADLGVWPGDPAASLLEAMACRLPIILPQSSETGYLDTSQAVVRFKRGNVLDLAEKINLLTIDGSLRQKLGKNGEKFIKNKLSWQKIAQKTLNLL